MDNIIYSIEEFAQSWLQFILSSSFQLGIFLVLIAALTLIFRKQSAKFLYILWLIGLFKVFIPPTIKIPDVFGSANLPIEPNIFILSIPKISFVTTSLKTPELSYKGYLLLFWIIGIFLISAVWIYNNIRFHWKIKRNSFSIDNTQLSMIVKYKNSRIRFYSSPDIIIPFTRGIFKPKIFLPNQALNWSKNELRAVVLHEYAHIKRKDIVVFAFQNLIQILFFFHPLVWLANIQIARYREKACDDFAINAMKGNSVDYSKFLLKSIDNALNWQPLPSMNTYFNQSKKSLLNRFEYILNRKENAMNKFSRFQKLVFIFLVIFGVAISCHKKQLSRTSPILNEQEIIKEDDSKDQSQLALFNKQFTEYDVPPKPIGGGIDIFELNEYAIKAGVLVTLSIDENGDNQSLKFTYTSKFNSKEWKNYFETGSRQGEIGKIKWSPAQKNGKSVPCKITFPFSSDQRIVVADEIKKGIIPPPPPSDSDDVQFVPYNEPPHPIGGFAAIQENLHYPEIARKAGIEGIVIIYAKIDTEGVVINTKIVKPLGENNGCNEAAIDALKSVKWKPAMQKKGKPVTVWVSVPVKFKISQETKEGLLVPGASKQGIFSTDDLEKFPYDTPPEPVGGYKELYKNIRFPAIARKAGIEGTVTIYTKVDETGKVVDTRIKESIGKAGMDEAAIEAIKRVKWHPAYLKGEAVAAWLAVPIQFKLTDGSFPIQHKFPGDKLGDLEKKIMRSQKLYIDGDYKSALKIWNELRADPNLSRFEKESLEKIIKFTRSIDYNDIAKQEKKKLSDSIEFVPYDDPPNPIGGFKAIQKKLIYPAIARQAGIEGKVIIYAQVSWEGKILKTKVVKPLGNSGCNEAAIQAIKSVEWKPALQKGKPVTTWVSVPVQFKLK